MFSYIQHRTPLLEKLLLLFCFTLGLFLSCIDMYQVFQIGVKHFTDTKYVFQIKWTEGVNAIVTGGIHAVVQGFFGVRLVKVSRKSPLKEGSTCAAKGLAVDESVLSLSSIVDGVEVVVRSPILHVHRRRTRFVHRYRGPTLSKRSLIAIYIPSCPRTLTSDLFGWSREQLQDRQDLQVFRDNLKPWIYSRYATGTFIDLFLTVATAVVLWKNAKGVMTR
jgi:hypothetical protein